MKVALVILLGLSAGCGTDNRVRVSGSTSHQVGGTAEVKHTINIQLEVCDDMPVKDRLECIKLIKQLAEEIHGNKK